MLKQIILIILIMQVTACAELNQVLGDTSGTGISNIQIANGLKEALQKGITNQVINLGGENGFFKNELVKIVLPKELQKVDQTLRNIGMASVADEGLKVLNRAAENAVGEAIPIFKEAIVNMSFVDVKNILMGDQNAATLYLQNNTSSALRGKFNPIIENSFQKVGADKVWSTIITRYNQVPFVNKVNPDLTNYVTTEAMSGVFKMIAVEEKEIRINLRSRTTDLLRRVFALQDN